MPTGLISGLVLLLLLGCSERDRLTFPDSNPDDDRGPEVTIDVPGSDTVLTEGDPFILAGRAVDSSGVDSVYFEITGANQAFLPLRGDGADTVHFGLPLQTIGHSGATIQVGVRAVDVLGNQGSTLTRRLRVE